MTNEQEQLLENMQGKNGDEAQFQALLSRSREIISQSFGMLRMISGSGTVSVLPGKSYFLSTDDNRRSLESNDA